MVSHFECAAPFLPIVCYLELVLWINKWRHRITKIAKNIRCFSIFRSLQKFEIEKQIKLNTLMLMICVLNHIEICRMLFSLPKYAAHALPLLSFLLFVFHSATIKAIWIANTAANGATTHHTLHPPTLNTVRIKKVYSLCVCFCFVSFLFISLIYLLKYEWRRMEAIQRKQFAKQAVAYVGLIRILCSMFTYTYTCRISAKAD